jgi:hypothetical protein
MHDGCGECEPLARGPFERAATEQGSSRDISCAPVYADRSSIGLKTDQDIDALDGGSLRGRFPGPPWRSQRSSGAAEGLRAYARRACEGQDAREHNHNDVGSAANIRCPKFISQPSTKDGWEQKRKRV